MAAAALACGFLAAPLFTAANAPASPGYCDGADCVPYVDRTAEEGTGCAQNTRYNFGIDPSGTTLACNSRGTWIASPPLVGIRTNRLPCGDTAGVAQTPDGFPLSCKDGAWTQDFTVIFYG
jgi:hypothetical protein